MGADSEFIAIYRMAEKKNKRDKNKIEGVNNLTCFNNFNKYFTGDKLYLFGDRLEESKRELVDNNYIFHEVQNHGNAESLMEAIEYAMSSFKDEDIVYFVEDDYLHKPGFVEAIKEGLERIDYVTCYDHLDKYHRTNARYELFYTDNYIWKLVDSTTMTFATKIKTIKKDIDIMRKWISVGIPNDYYMFLEINQILPRLASLVPGLSTHTEIQFLSPTTNWNQYV